MTDKYTRNVIVIDEAGRTILAPTGNKDTEAIRAGIIHFLLPIIEQNKTEIIATIREPKKPPRKIGVPNTNFTFIGTASMMDDLTTLYNYKNVTNEQRALWKNSPVYYPPELSREALNYGGGAIEFNDRTRHAHLGYASVDQIAGSWDRVNGVKASIEREMVNFLNSPFGGRLEVARDGVIWPDDAKIVFTKWVEQNLSGQYRGVKDRTDDLIEEWQSAYSGTKGIQLVSNGHLAIPKKTFEEAFKLK